MEELEALLGGVPTPAVQAETEKKPEVAATVVVGEGEGKKKKKKKKAGDEEKKADEPKPAETPAVELTAEEKEAAIREALKKRAAGSGQHKGKETLLTAKIEKAERKQKSKKAGKAEDFDR